MNNKTSEDNANSQRAASSNTAGKYKCWKLAISLSPLTWASHASLNIRRPGCQMGSLPVPMAALKEPDMVQELAATADDCKSGRSKDTVKNTEDGALRRIILVRVLV